MCQTPGVPGGGAGIYNRGTLTLARSIVSGNAAAVDTEDESGRTVNRGSATIEMSELTGNRGAAGGGIMNYGELRTSDTQLTSNGGRVPGRAGLANAVRRNAVRHRSGNVRRDPSSSNAPSGCAGSTVSGNHSQGGAA